MSAAAQPLDVRLRGRALSPVACLVGLLGVALVLTYPFPLVWVGAVLLVGLGLVRWRSVGRPFAATPFNLPILLYLAGGVLGLLLSLSREMAGLRFAGLIAATATFYLVVDLATTPRGARGVVTGLLAVALLGVPLLLLLGAAYLRDDRLPGPLGQLVDPLYGLAAPLRAIGVPNAFGGQRFRLHASGPGALAGYGIGLALGPLLVGRHGWARPLAAGATLVGLAGLVMAGNRAAVLAAVLVALLLGSVRLRWLLPLALLVVGLAVAALSGFIRPEQLDRLHELPFLPESATDLGPFRVRQEYWDNVLFLMGDFRFSGVGLGLRSVRLVYDAYFAPISVGFSHAHNIFLQSYLEQGLLGLAGLLGIAMVGLWLCWRALVGARNTPDRAVVVSGMGAFLVLLLSGLTDVVATTSLGMVLLYAAMALLFASARLTAAAGAAGPRPRHAHWVPRAARAAALATLPLVGLVLIVTLRLGPSTERAPLDRLPGLPRELDYDLSINLAARDLAAMALAEYPPERREADRRFSSATARLRRAQQLDRADPTSYRIRSALYAAHREPTEARFMLEQAEPLAPPGDGRFLFQLGRIYREIGDVGQAVALWSRVDPAVGAWTCAGPAEQLAQWSIQLIEIGQLNKAIDVSRAAIKVAPVEPVPVRNLATAYRLLRREQSLIGAMTELTVAYPDVPWAYDEISKAYARGFQVEQSEAWHARAAAVEGSAGWAAMQREWRAVRACAEEADAD